MNFGVLFYIKKNASVTEAFVLKRRLRRANDSVNYRASMMALNSATGRIHFFRSSGFGR